MGIFCIGMSVFRYRGPCLKCIGRWDVVFLKLSIRSAWIKELLKRGIPFVAHHELKLSYKGEPLRQTYVPDFVCDGIIIVELKALTQTTGEHKAQVLNYLKATGMRLGLLVNFGCYPKATVERIVL